MCVRESRAIYISRDYIVHLLAGDSREFIRSDGSVRTFYFELRDTSIFSRRLQLVRLNFRKRTI